ncbi:hypothetical protein [Paludisphaera rhizosphaerae]|uniref:hypothetical protein n=1 Tax=Paludisphaera rhizosphaerae TaxID=2711216 RepID=UPI0013EDBC74|nr:hypothetical protein [Paludisphaera rhizosphaerae]
MNPQDDRLERLWQATRPAAPSAAAWDDVWASVTRELDRPEAKPLTLAMPVVPAPRGRWAAVALVLLSQAAAAAIAVGLALHGRGPIPDARQVSQRVTSTVHIEEGQLVLIRPDLDALQVADLSREGGVDPWHLLLNRLEYLAAPAVAMSE